MKTGLRSIFVLVMTVMLLIGAGMGHANGAEQSVALSPSMADQMPGSAFTLSAFYEVSDGNDMLTGLGLRFHFDSNNLQFMGYNNELQTGLVSIEDQPRDDVLNLDDDAKTDSYVTIGWVSFRSPPDWPSRFLPLELVKLDFMVDEAAPDGPTPVNVSFSRNAGGYTTSSTDATINVTTSPGTIIGTIVYTGSAEGTIKVGAYSDEDLQNLVAETEQEAPGDFEIGDVPPGTYYVSAKLDLVDRIDRKPAGQAGAPVTVVSGQAADAGNIVVYHIATNIVLEANPSHISSMTPSESTLTATIWDDHGYVVDEGPDSTLEVLFAVTDPTYGDIKDVQINPVVAENGVATILIESKEDDSGGDIPCTADATGAQGQGDLAQGTVTVTTSPFNIMPRGPVALLVGDSQEFYVTAGSPPYTWAVMGGGTLDKSVTQDPNERVTFTAPRSETLGITLMVTDNTGLESAATINVYEPVEIPDKPDDPPTLRVGDSSPTLTVEGGDGSYTWTAKDSDGAILDMEEDGSYVYTPERIGAFAGPHTIGATDSNGFGDSFDVHVPMEFTPQSMNILAGEESDLVLAGVASSVIDPAQISSVEFLDEGLNVIPEEEMDGYATFSPLPPIPFLSSSEATVTLTGASVTEAKTFQFRATVSGDPDLTDSNGLNVATTGWIRVLPTVTYSGRVKRMDPEFPIHGATVMFKLGGMPQGDPLLTSIDGSFSAQLPSPAITGSEYDVVVLADNYVSRTDLTTAGWDMENGETITLVEADEVISGTVKSTEAEGEPIYQALVECTADGQTCLAYTNALGEYEVFLPVELDEVNGATTTWNYQTTDNYADACEPEEDDTGTATTTEVGGIVTVVVDDGPTYTGTVDGSDYHLTTEYTGGGETCTEIVDFTLSLSGTEGSGTLTWSCTEDGVTCNGGSDLSLIKQDGGDPTELLATASAAGYASATQDILVDPDFLLNPLASGDEVGPEGGILTSGDCVINIPAGALDGPAQIELDCDIDVGPESVYTEHSVTLIEINVIGANINEDTPIQVTIPFDTAHVNPGDFAAGTARINYADSTDDLRNGKDVKIVPSEDIAFEDHLNGLAGFQLRHASVFGVGGKDAKKKGGGGSDCCFVQTATSKRSLGQRTFCPIPLAQNVLLAIVMFGLVTGAYVLLRRRR